MNLLRTVEAEWLDQLAADDPRAIRSRLDLRRINTCMLQAAIMARRRFVASSGRSCHRRGRTIDSM